MKSKPFTLLSLCIALGGVAACDEDAVGSIDSDTFASEQSTFEGADALGSADSPARAVAGSPLSTYVNGDDAVLRWTPIPGAVQYGIVLGHGPYFTPSPYISGAMSTFLGSVWVSEHADVELSFVHEGAATRSRHSYYRIVGWDADGGIMGYSTIAALFVQDLVPGRNQVGFPLLDGSVASASELATEVAGAYAIKRWDTDTQAWQRYRPVEPTSDFTIESGSAIQLNVDAPTRMLLTGLVPEPEDIVHAPPVGRALVAAPIWLADNYEPIDGQLVSTVFPQLESWVWRIDEWNPAMQSYDRYDGDADDPDFMVEAGSAVWLRVDDLGSW